MGTSRAQELALQAEVRRLRERVANLEQERQHVEERQARTGHLQPPAWEGVPIQESKARRTGIPIVGDVPWGTHFCEFYQDKQDLIDTLVPYFKAGLENNEFCMWITSEPLRSVDAIAALTSSVEGLETYIASGQLEILEYSEWFMLHGTFESERVVEGWIARLEHATSRGFEGLRLSANTFWLQESDWQIFQAYEATINAVIAKYRMLAVCTYCVSKYGAIEVADVISKHAFALMKRAGKWEKIDNAVRKEGGVSLRDTEERLRMAIASTGLGIWHLDPATGSIIASDLCKRHYGLRTDRDTDYSTFVRALHPHDRERVDAAVQAVLKPDSGGHFEAEYRTVGIDDGQERCILDMGRAFFDCKGVPVRLIGTTLDITARKRAEEELRRGREWFRGTLASIGDAVLTTDTSGTITFLNPVAAELTGWKVEDALGRPVSDVFRTSDKESLTNTDRVLEESSVTALGKYTTLVTRSGGEIPIENTATRISDREGNVMGSVFVFRDITARRRAQAELRAVHEDAIIQQNRLRAILEALPDGVSLIDAKGGLIESNAAIEDVWGGPQPAIRSVEDYAICKAWWADTGRPVQPEEWAAARAVQKGETVVNQKLHIERFDGTRALVLNSAAPIRDAQGRITGSAVAIRDITELTNAEQALRDSEERFRALVTATTNVVYRMSSDWKELLYLRNRYSTDAEESNRTWLQKYIHRDDQQYVTSVIEEAIRSRSVFELEHRVRQVDGSWGWTFSRAVPIQNEVGEVIEWFGVSTDITERKRAEEALRRSEARWNAAIENVEAGVVIATDTEQVIYRNPAARAMHGFTNDQGGTGPLDEMEGIFQLRTPDGRLLPLDEWPMRRIKRGETLNRLELRLHRLDQGWEKIISYSGAMVESAIGERLMFISAQDLTDQRKAEQSLRDSEERLRLLGDNLPDSSVFQYIDDLDGSVRCTYFSAGIERLNGVTAAEMLRDARTLQRQILPGHLDRFVEAKSRSKRDLSDIDIELPMRRPDGEIRWMHFHSHPQRLPDGRTVWDGVQTDVTARKQAEDSLREKAELLRLSYDAMIVWKLDGVIESWNVGAERLYGYSESEAVGKVTHTLLLPRFPKPWDEILAEMRIVGSWEGEVRQHTRDRREVVVSARIQLINGSDGIYRVLEVNRDITEALRAQVEAFARQKLESLGTLASGIAHDFNNLLGAVLAQAELASAGLAGGSRPEEELETIREVAIRGSDIVRQLMIYAGKESDVIEFIDISKTVEEMYGLLKSAISKRVTLVTDLPENLPPVKARTAQLRQVLMNLVVNASDAIKDSNGTIRITTRCVTVGSNNADAYMEELTAGDYVQLRVSDTGGGMSQEVRARIFDPFFSTKATGRGLGLPVIHGIVRNLRGAIRIDSAVGKGSTFEILLPAEGTAAGETCDVSGGKEEDSHKTSEATVLLVEDEAPLRSAVTKLLGKAGFAVLEAADGYEAVEFLRCKTTRIDLLVLDMTIPGCSSHDVLSEVVEGWPKMKVILTSAYSKEMVTSSLSAPNVCGFIRKPFDLRTLLSTLRNALSS